MRQKKSSAIGATWAAVDSRLGGGAENQSPRLSERNFGGREMSIEINGQHITLHTKSSTYQMSVKNGLLVHLYYGSRLDGSFADCRTQLGFHSFSPFPYDCVEERLSPDLLPMEYPVSGGGEFRTPALSVEFEDGSRVCDLRFAGAEILDGKPELKGLPAFFDREGVSQTLEICLRDTVYDLRVYLLYTVFEQYDAITRSARIVNRTGGTVILNAALSTCLDFFDDSLDFITFYGKHIGERSLNRARLSNNKLVCESVRGASSHQQNPFVITAERDCGEKRGVCYGSAFVYSGNFTASLESTQIHTARLVLGINPTGFRYVLSDGEEFQAPEVIHVYSEAGFGAMSRNYHRIIRRHLFRGEYSHSVRPVLLNNWEATYFRFDAEKLCQIAEKAKSIGADTFVLDDGWFKGRNNDRSSLGDWVVDENKLGCSLKELISRVNAMGLRFGLWFEPECVSENSDLYRSHPEWCLQAPGRPGSLSRHQWVVDMSNPDAVDCIFGQMKAILDENPIGYVKWDFNRHLSDIYSPVRDSARQGEVSHRYMLGVYDLLERLHNRYPNLLIEGCSGGGGRFDCGMLYYSPQIWTSDNTDPICRLDIQYGTSFCYPIISMGSHVTVSPNHQTRRVTPFKTRSSVAMAGTYGFELDLTKLSEEEIAFLNDETAFYRKYAPLVLEGDYYRLTAPGGEHMAWEIVSESADRALITVVQTQARCNCKPFFLQADGLDASAEYTVVIDGTPLEQPMTGCALMKIGFPVATLNAEYTSVRIELLRK